MTKYLIVFLIGVLVGVLLTEKKQPTPLADVYDAIRKAEQGGIADFGSALDDLR